MDALSEVLSTFRLHAEIFHNAQYCGDWAVDTSGSGHISFHMITHGDCYAESACFDAAVHLQTGDFVMFPHDASHTIKPHEQCQVKVNEKASIAFSEGVVGDGVGLLCGYFRIVHQANNPIIKFLPPAIVIKKDASPEQKSTYALFEIIRQESLACSSGYQTVLNRLCASLFIMILRDHIETHEQHGGILAGMADTRISKALNAIHEHADTKWTVEALADIASMSRSSFAESFKSLLGQTPKQYLADWRMQRAWVWLSEDNETVLEVALRSGYETEAAFSKAFKRIIGQTPGEVRRSNNRSE